MTKSLSQELCELCGVEPKYCVAKYSYYMSEWVYVSKDKIKEHDIMRKELVYPDFESPENFVKLLELLHITNPVCVFDLIGYIEAGTNSIATKMLEVLVKVLNIEIFGYTKESVNTIKQAIRDTEWKY